MSPGYTLLEMLIALALFALVSTMAFGGLTSSLRVADHVRAEAAFWRSLSSAWTIMETDVVQCGPAPDGAARGEPEEPELRLWLAPAARPESGRSERRTTVVYRRVDDSLWRLASFSRGTGAERVAASRLLEGVDGFSARLAYPPQESRPRSVEVVMTLRGRGRWSRILECQR